MANLKIVLNWASICTSSVPMEAGCDTCPYREKHDGFRTCIEGLLFDALALLKEQEAKPMIENEHGWNCPSCGMKLIGKTASGYPCDLIDLPEDEPIHFCQKCGQAVKWE